MGDLYNTINELCKQKNTNITAMCKEIGIGRATFSELKMGRTKTLSSETLLKIAEYFGVSAEYLTGKEQKPAAKLDDELSEYLEELKNRSEMRMLFKLAKNATKEDVEQAVKIIEALKK